MTAVIRDPGALRRLAGAYRLSQAIAAAASIGIADVLARGPTVSERVASETGADPATLHRLMLALAGEGVLDVDEDGRFSLTPVGECLRSDDPEGTRAMVLGWSCLREGYEAFAHLHESVLTGRSGFELRFGEPFHEYLESHPERGAAYLAAMDSTEEVFQGAIDTYDFSDTQSVVDVGGGGGAFLTCLLRSYPHIRGVLFELPTIVERVSLPSDVADRIEVVAGDATESLPPGADAYVFCTVLRCFSDDRAVTLLSRCREAMHSESRILACEMVMPSGQPESMRGLADLQALTLYGGADRDQSRWQKLFTEAGLELRAIKPADPPYSWVVASAA